MPTIDEIKAQQAAEELVYRTKIETWEANLNIEKDVIKQAYQDAITTLGQIQAATNPTNAQVVQATKNLAEIQEKVLKFIKAFVAEK